MFIFGVTVVLYFIKILNGSRNVVYPYIVYQLRYDDLETKQSVRGHCILFESMAAVTLALESCLLERNVLESVNRSASKHV
jgi:hypothetical protein